MGYCRHGFFKFLFAPYAGDAMTATAVRRWDEALANGRRASLLLRNGAFNLLLDDEAPSFTFDLRGRLHGAFLDGVNYRRSLDNRVLAKWSAPVDGQPQRQRRWLDQAEARCLLARVSSLVSEIAQAGAALPDIAAALELLRGWDWPALEADRAWFQRLYSPIGILPPDQYLAVVLQATEGCSHNACTFCTLYQDVPFRIKSPQEFRSHVLGVAQFFGPALAMRRSLFLADANALVTPMPRLLALLEVLRDAGGEWRGVAALPWFAFIDAFHVERKSLADWQELRGRGLARVYIGMESGHDPLLRWLNKPGTAADVLEAVQTLKAAGIQASVIVMVGVGGAAFAEGHLRDTATLLNAMPLGRGDLVYLSDFVEQPGAAYAGLAAAAGIAPLPASACRSQEQVLRSLFVAHDANHPPQFARYALSDFVY